MPKAKREENLQLALCRYVKLQYPKALFDSSMAGVRLTPGQAAKAKRQRSTDENGETVKFPDFVIYEKSEKYWHDRFEGFNAFNGLFLELKKEGKRLQKKDGTWYPHEGKQWETIRKLRERGFAAGFCVGLDNAIKAVDAYMGSDFNALQEAFYKPIK